LWIKFFFHYAGIGQKGAFFKGLSYLPNAHECIRLELNFLKRMKNVPKNGQKMAKILPNIVAIPVFLQFAYLTQPTGIQSFLDFL
jgi:hypothetical protein